MILDVFDGTDTAEVDNLSVDAQLVAGRRPWTIAASILPVKTTPIQGKSMLLIGF